MLKTNNQMEASDLHRSTFSKAERLSSKKIIASLFEAGQSFLIAPLRVIHQRTVSNSTCPVQVAITVSKKKFPKAVDRNRIKRLIREAYRINKHELYKHLTGNNISIAVIIIYTSHSITTFNAMENKIKLVLMRLMQEYDVVA
ncbi:MAG: ribonuclease P protein component [Fimbriimonadaceae bacterium]|nr:ribonuclease P protein component [Chitinophagales bacterium]